MNVKEFESSETSYKTSNQIKSLYTECTHFYIIKLTITQITDRSGGMHKRKLQRKKHLLFLAFIHFAIRFITNVEIIM